MLALGDGLLKFPVRLVVPFHFTVFSPSESGSSYFSDSAKLGDIHTSSFCLRLDFSYLIILHSVQYCTHLGGKSRAFVLTAHRAHLCTMRVRESGFMDLQEFRAYIDFVMRHGGFKSPTAIARKSGFAPTTITRPYYDDDVASLPKYESVIIIGKKTGITWEEFKGIKTPFNEMLMRDCIVVVDVAMPGADVEEKIESIFDLYDQFKGVAVDGKVGVDTLRAALEMALKKVKRSMDSAKDKKPIKKKL